MSEITPEITLDPSVVPPLDESLLTLSDEESEFLHKSITSDDAELKKRILEVQKEYVFTSTCQSTPNRGFSELSTFVATCVGAGSECRPLIQCRAPVPVHPRLSLREPHDGSESRLSAGPGSRKGRKYGHH